MIKYCLGEKLISPCIPTLTLHSMYYKQLFVLLPCRRLASQKCKVPVLEFLIRIELNLYGRQILDENQKRRHY